MGGKWAVAIITVAVLLFGIFIWPTPFSYHYDRSGESVVRLNRLTGYAERLPIHKPADPRRGEEDEWLGRWLSRFHSPGGTSLTEIEQDPDFQNLPPVERDKVRLRFLREYVLTTPGFRSLPPKDKSRIASRVMAIEEGPGTAELFIQSVRKTHFRWEGGR